MELAAETSSLLGSFLSRELRSQLLSVRADLVEDGGGDIVGGVLSGVRCEVCGGGRERDRECFIVDSIGSK